MYISKVFLNVSIPLVRHDLSSLNFFYETLKKISGGGDPVYRIDNVPLNKTGYIQPVVLVSEKKPVTVCEKLPSGYVVKIETYEYNIPIRNGMVYKYYLRANPSVRMLFMHSDLETEESWRKWLESEGIINGFQIVDLKVTDDGYVTCPDKKVKFVSVIFEGALKVTDENRFRKSLHSGIGRGREYGLGLLSIESFGCKNRNIAEEMKASVQERGSLS
jgi:CRISPR-associated protein Cas6/Cse3/CasE subtype I-E